jgi:hypothetical protein
MFYTFYWEHSKKTKCGHRYFVPFDFPGTAENAQANLSDDHFPDHIPLFSDLILTDDSKESDFIEDMGAIGGTGYIVSNKIKDILAGFNLPPHRFYSLPYIRQANGKAHKVMDYYFWWQILLEDVEGYIDYQQSEFKFKEVFTDKTTAVKVNSPEELKNEAANATPDRVFNYDKLYLNEKYLNKSYDFFFFPYLSYHPFVTERLKEKFENDNVTGIYFEKRETVFLKKNE